MQHLIRAILTLGSEALASEEAACAALAALRWPDSIACPRCGAASVRDLAQLTCTGRRPHRFTLLAGTVFGAKRRPRIRPLLLALRFMSATHRSISARELARDVGMNHVTLWRHLHTLRALLPSPPAWATERAAVVEVCRNTSTSSAAFIRVGARQAMHRLRAPAVGSSEARLVGESVRAWLIGTFHGVSARWLHRYLQEIASRWAHAARDLLERSLSFFVDARAPLAFASLREVTIVR